MNNSTYQNFINILKEELVPAMGCTEPIAIAYCAAKARDTLGSFPDEITITVSGNIIKNVKSVKVPHTGGRVGIDVACAIGTLAGDSTKQLEVISNVTNEEIEKLEDFMNKTKIDICASHNFHTLYIDIMMKKDNHTSRVVIQDGHTNIALIEKDGQELYRNDEPLKRVKSSLDKSELSIKNIIDFADHVDTSLLKDTLVRQINYNMQIAKEGLEHDYGANIGKTILRYTKGDIFQYCKALAASASDARMNGCDMPVVINSGSGNQGITCSVPVVTYAREEGKTEEELYRALIVSNLCTIHIKDRIGKLSAFCGVVIAGAGCGAGICYLEGGKEEAVSQTITNTLAIISGTVCDGAKSSCAAKISASVEAGFLGYYMYRDGNKFFGGDGIIKKDVENTIEAVGKLARDGMCETDKEIIHIMIDK